MVTSDARPPGRFALLGRGLLLCGQSLAGLFAWSAVAVSVSLATAWVGIPLTLATMPWLRGLADQRRRWVGQLTGVPVARPYLPLPESGRLARARALARDPATRRDVIWGLVDAPVAVVLCSLPAIAIVATGWYLLLPAIFPAFPPGMFHSSLGVLTIDSEATSFLGWPVAAACFGLFWWTTRPLLGAYAQFSRKLLAPAPSASLARRVVELTESRAETVDSQAAELRRIERDLHDGAQARLVSLGMSLGMAQEMLARDPDAAATLLAEARQSTGQALSELRDLVRGIHPPVLADRGLEGAVRALALASALPVEVTIDLPGRPPAPVESALYFAVAEALANAAKHSAASAVWIRIAYADGGLGVMVGDDGRGGAEVAVGGGLYGIERRLAAFDGTMLVTSPPGGPTIVTMEVPCALSSVKTSPSSGTA